MTENNDSPERLQVGQITRRITLGELDNPEVVTAIKRAMGLTQKRMAGMLGVGEQNIRKWQRNGMATVGGGTRRLLLLKFDLHLLMHKHIF